MKLLLMGLLLWSGVHYIPGFMPDVKKKMVEILGAAYRGVFALLIVISIFLIVLGWKSTEIEILYDPITDAQVTSVLMIISFYLFAAAHGPSNVKRFIRHPMLTGVIVWAGAHLLANGENRSIVLFAGMIIWAVSEIIIINKREGAYEIPAPAPIKKDIIKGVIALVVFTAIVFAHPYIAGVPIMAM